MQICYEQFILQMKFEKRGDDKRNMRYEKNRYVYDKFVYIIQNWQRFIKTADTEATAVHKISTWNFEIWNVPKFTVYRRKFNENFWNTYRNRSTPGSNYRMIKRG